MAETLIYARRSSESGDDYSLDTQAAAGRQYAAAHGLGACEVVLENYTGTKHLSEREHGAEVWAAIRSGQVRHLIVYCVDRLSRSKLRHSLNLIDEIIDAGTHLHACDVGEITNTDDIGLIIRSWQASEERKKIVDRMMRGKYGKIKAGKWVGSGPAPYGFERVGRLSEAHLVRDERAADVVRWMFGRYLGADGPAVAILGLRDELYRRGIPSPGGHATWRVATIARVLASPAMIGQFDYGDQSVMLPDLAIVSRDEWQAVQARLEVNRERSPRNRQQDYLLSSSRLRCSCGRTMHAVCITSRGKPYRYYTCGQGGDHESVRTCSVQRVRMSEVDAAVWAWVEEHVTDDRLRDGIEQLRQHECERATDRTRLTELERESKQLLTKMADLMNQFGDAHKRHIVEARDAAIDQAADRLAAIDVEREQLAGEIERAEARLNVRRTLAQRVGELRSKLAAMDVAQRAGFLDVIGFGSKLVERDPLRIMITSEIAPPETITIP